ncbi:hypothetical protein [Sphingomonas sp.]|uniref:hypothetical protein n=1 Tax=Sphingomonas sp. TaxID=28214 RepID=UPI003CC59274
MNGSGNETVEQKVRRRRWLSLAEFVAVAGVLIAGAGLYLTWSDRQASRADHARSSAAEERVTLTATVADGGRTLRLADTRHEISDVAIAYPRALGIVTQRPSGDPVITTDAIGDTLLRLTDGGSDSRSGRLPVLVTVTYVDGDARRDASGVYDVVWATHGRMLRGRVLVLTGLRLRQRGGGQAAVDAAWAREKP